MEMPSDSRDEWRMNYLSGDLSREGNSIVYAAKVLHELPIRGFIVYNFYSANRDGKFTKTVFNGNDMEKIFESSFADEPPIPSIPVADIIKGYSRSLVLVGLPTFYLTRSVSAALAAAAMVTGIPVSIITKAMKREHMLDMEGWNEYKKFLDGVYRA